MRQICVRFASDITMVLAIIKNGMVFALGIERVRSSDI